MKKLILLIILACLSGCYHTPTKKEEAKFPEGWTLVNCSECNGKGNVTYGEDHWMVLNDLCDPGTYTCPICQGDRQLYSR